MDLIQTILMGIVQGLSEFLPISSSAHLVFTSNFYKVFKGIEIVQESNQEVFLDIMLHLGTLIAVLIFFRKDIMEICKALYFGLKNKDYSSKDFKTGLYIILGTFITVLIAFICIIYYVTFGYKKGTKSYKLAIILDMITLIFSIIPMIVFINFVEV